MCPTYEFKCTGCTMKVDVNCPMERRDDNYGCPECSGTLARQLSAPTVMTAALPDGTRRFDSLRQTRALERQLRTERDKTQREKLKRELTKIPVKEAS